MGDSAATAPVNPASYTVTSSFVFTISVDNNPLVFKAGEVITEGQLQDVELSRLLSCNALVLIEA